MPAVWFGFVQVNNNIARVEREDAFGEVRYPVAGSKAAHVMWRATGEVYQPSRMNTTADARAFTTLCCCCRSAAAAAATQAAATAKSFCSPTKGKNEPRFRETKRTLKITEFWF